MTQRLIIKLDVEIKNGQSRETDNIGYRRHITTISKTQHRKQKQRAIRTPSTTVG